MDDEFVNAVKLCEKLAVSCQQTIAEFGSARRRAALYRLEDLKASLFLALVATRRLSQYVESTREELAEIEPQSLTVE